MVGTAMAARGVTAAFMGEIGDFYRARSDLERRDLLVPEKDRVRGALVKLLREKAEGSDAELAKHETNARRAAEAHLPAAMIRAKVLEDPIRVNSLRELLKDAPVADVIAIAKRAVETKDYAVAAALSRLGREFDPEETAIVQRATGMRSEAFDKAIADLIVVRHERARLATALEFADPTYRGGIAASNAERDLEIEGVRVPVNQTRITEAYARADVDMHLAMPSPPEPAEMV